MLYNPSITSYSGLFIPTPSHVVNLANRSSEIEEHEEIVEYINHPVHYLPPTIREQRTNETTTDWAERLIRTMEVCHLIEISTPANSNDPAVVVPKTISVLKKVDVTYSLYTKFCSGEPVTTRQLELVLDVSQVQLNVISELCQKDFNSNTISTTILLIDEWIIGTRSKLAILKACPETIATLTNACNHLNSIGIDSRNIQVVNKVEDLVKKYYYSLLYTVNYYQEILKWSPKTISNPGHDTGANSNLFTSNPDELIESAGQLYISLENTSVPSEKLNILIKYFTQVDLSIKTDLDMVYLEDVLCHLENDNKVESYDNITLNTPESGLSNERVLKISNTGSTLVPSTPQFPLDTEDTNA